MAGGHTIRSEEPIFGLAVQGLVHPDRIFTKGGAQPGDVLVLSKPVGTGIVLAGGSADDKAAAIAVMRTLNRARGGGAAATGLSVHAVTDVTGFGLLGHGWEMAERAGVRCSRSTRTRCRCTQARWRRPSTAFAPAATPATGSTWRGGSTVAPSVADALEALAYDPQTSGGLLACGRLRGGATRAGAGFAVVGEVVAGPAGVSLS